MAEWGKGYEPWVTWIRNYCVATPILAFPQREKVGNWGGKCTKWEEDEPWVIRMDRIERMRE